MYYVIIFHWNHKKVYEMIYYTVHGIPIGNKQLILKLNFSINNMKMT